MHPYLSWHPRRMFAPSPILQSRKRCAPSPIYAPIPIVIALSITTPSPILAPMPITLPGGNFTSGLTYTPGPIRTPDPGPMGSFRSRSSGSSCSPSPDSRFSVSGGGSDTCWYVGPCAPSASSVAQPPLRLSCPRTAFRVRVHYRCSSASLRDSVHSNAVP